MIEVNWMTHDSAADMADAVAGEVRRAVQNAIETRGNALIALPGGRSPDPIFSRLSEADLDWDRVTIVPTDDRLVPLTDPLSNVAIIARRFLPRGAHVIPIAVEGAVNYRTAGWAADARLAGLNWPLDLAWLGVGADGHVASIFPGPDLAAALDGQSNRKAIGLMPDPLPPEAPVPRITLNCSTLVSARRLLLAFSGVEKRAVVERASEHGARSKLPIGQVLAAAEGPITVHWSET